MKRTDLRLYKEKYGYRGTYQTLHVPIDRYTGRQTDRLLTNRTTADMEISHKGIGEVQQ